MSTPPPTLIGPQALVLRLYKLGRITKDQLEQASARLAAGRRSPQRAAGQTITDGDRTPGG